MSPGGQFLVSLDTGRTLHPAEMLGDDWYTYGDWGLDVDTPPVPPKP